MKFPYIFLSLFFIIFSSGAFAETNTVSMRIVESPKNSSNYMVNLIDNRTGNPLTEANLKLAHTKRLRFLIIDPSLTEYYNIYPTIIKDGVWGFYFPLARTHKFRVWADITRIDTGKQEYAAAEIGSYDPKYKIIKLEKVLNNEINIGEYNFALKLDGDLKAGDTTMGSITVNKNGVPFTELEPVMGSFSSAVGFFEDYRTVVYIHPMGKEPETANDRNGPVLHFRIEPNISGFMKIFAQFKINGQDVYAPFGVMVK